MDPLADKLLVCGAFVAFSLMPVLNISWWLVALILFREVFVTVMRVAALRRNAPIKTEYSGKIKTCIQMVTIVAILILLILYRETGVLKGGVAAIPPALVVLSALIALISMVQYVIRNRHVFTRQAEY
jgi:CDP-diacylglycerol--glycerol-3-phosphate 3-phosphatidyltransferase